jgi:hypothetical protein
MLGDDPRPLQDYLLLLDLLSESAERGNQAAETHGEVIDKLTFPELDALEFKP